MSVECFADSGPGCVDVFVEKCLFQGDEVVIGEKAEEYVGFDAAWYLVEYGTFGEWTFHCAEGGFGACEGHVDTPCFVGGKV